ncbi:hypothetical protein DFH06DRAFT_1179215 [Mycena polygramma]|nr:hypothetical protein DFH06DRAFT_1179215 [Mycena polygramma]
MCTLRPTIPVLLVLSTRRGLGCSTCNSDTFESHLVFFFVRIILSNSKETFQYRLKTLLDISPNVRKNYRREHIFTEFWVFL